jgi:hypothetical protein
MTKPVVLLVVGACTAALALPATASARSTYCSPSGDVCYGALKSGKTVKLNITLQARYFTRYRLCVTPPKGKRTCISANVMKAKNGTYASTISWASKFPNRGQGTYTARWYTGSSSLGPAVTFKR